MPKREHVTSKRSPLRRRLETTIQFGALVFFIVLGSAIYQNVSRGAPIAGGPAALDPIEMRSNSTGPADTRLRERESAPPSPNQPPPAVAPPSEMRSSEERPTIAGSSKPTSDIAAPSDTKPREQEPSATATIKPEPKPSSLSPALLDCATGSPKSWEFANVQLIDSTSGRAASLVTSCRISSDIAGPVGCQSPVIVGVGVASSKGINATESARALRRGINLASALKKNLQAGCPANVTVSAYVLNLGRYSDEQQRDEPDQRKVIALVATGAEDGDKAAADAVSTYTKNDPKIAHYPICELYKLDSAGQPTLVPTRHDICGDQLGSTLTQR
jgi:hypothetical protein